MANLPISGLTASASNAAATDVLPVVQTTGTGPVKMTVQQMAGGLLGSTTISGATVTTSQPVLNLAQTWNNAAVTFTGLKFNVPTDTSASTSLLMDLQIGGTTKFVVDKAGRIRGDSSTNIQSYLSFDSSSGGSPFIGNFATSLVTFAIPYGYGSVQLYNTVPFGFVSSGNALTGTLDTILTRRGAANLRFGAADAAAPVDQTLSVQSVVAGTSNTAGANLTITGSQGTGTGAGGSIIFQVAPAGGTGTAQNALATALQIVSTSATTTTFQFWQPSIGTARSVELITCDNAGIRVGGIISFAASGEVRFGAFNDGGYYSTFYSNNVERWQINTSGHLLAATDNTYDIGASGATRPRDIYLGGKIVTASVQAVGAGTGVIFRNNGATGVAQIDANGSVNACYATTLPAGGTAGRGLTFSSNITNMGVFFGSGAPTLSAAKGSLYLRSDGTTVNDRMYVNTDGSTTWTAVTTVG